ncbi:hypothetical protein EKO04_008606 [Ascochyta lentis]|uniref:Uncharacterized protein n=1 Tax=Ascochyta lentis TaxID=205686 RepID=A0A8H7MFM1_9PLEO|nr:hypothetical protein EKO04_008606 [Ascochyta lentis]
MAMTSTATTRKATTRKATTIMALKSKAGSRPASQLVLLRRTTTANLVRKWKIQQLSLMTNTKKKSSNSGSVPKLSIYDNVDIFYVGGHN